jgi:hypothetical protein
MAGKLFVIEKTEAALVPVLDYLKEAQDAANAGQRSRTAALQIDSVRAKILAKDDGHAIATGGGVPNSYGYSATTTVVGVAWITEDSGRLHVRVIAARLRAPKSAHARRSIDPFPGDHYLTAVYPELLDALKPIPKSSRRKATAITDTIRDHLRDEDWMDAGAWCQLVDMVGEMQARPEWLDEGAERVVRSLFASKPATA